ncbi:MAG: universal stress protein [Bacteroidia bacterium]
MKAVTNKKTVLVGVDFTASSENAVKYAVLLAEKNKHSLTLFHVFDVPIVNTYSGSFFISYTDLQLSNQVKLNKYVEVLKKKHPKLEIKTLVKAGSVKYNLKEIENHRNIFCVVIGLETKTRISKFIYGTTGVDIAGKIKCPVIIVPKSYTDHRINQAVFAVDNKKSLHSPLLQKIDKLKEALNIKLKYVHIRTPEEILLDEKLETKKIKLDQIEASDFTGGMATYNKQNKIDLDIIASHSHSAIYKLFAETNTKSIALSSKIPVLVVHD